MLEFAIWFSLTATIGCLIFMYLGTERRRPSESAFFHVCPGCMGDVRVGLGDCPRCGWALGSGHRDGTGTGQRGGAGQWAVKDSNLQPWA